MTIPKKQLNFVTQLMEALPLNGHVYELHPDVTFCPHDEVYFGYFDRTVINKMQEIGVITIVGHHDDEQMAIKLVERDDFLASFAAGANEARNGNDLLYADYNSNQYAFTCGWQHWHNRNTKTKKPPAYNSDLEYVCHGMLDIGTNEIHRQ
ncbi:hypothetical protein L4174_023900 (plasmid) [Photobacterium sp. CCB-ST2H9]|uniref:hypothetical protein n=1 Tax=Photobacterium sp. CCB-ST2H9 TaxID=2912855 RepID=UPI002005C77B|nr:hypothetical protein [Photobacterium sp. CCB-ST2H9]UTM60431.1 hypothetical protein L4174_023900 [Photobacterium sp. CCB-ST2H9]